MPDKDPRRVLLGRLGAYTMQSRHDGREITREAREAFMRKFEQEVDPDGVLDPTERLRRAELARKAHMTRLALLSVQKRSRGRQAS